MERIKAAINRAKQARAATLGEAPVAPPRTDFETYETPPGWLALQQIEPDEEFNYGDPEDYYFIDEQGNLIEPGRGAGEPGPASEGATERTRPGEGADGEPQAVDDDFLERAIGGSQGGQPNGTQTTRPQPPQQQPPPQPRPSPQPLQPGREAPPLAPQRSPGE